MFYEKNKSIFYCFNFGLGIFLFGATPASANENDSTLPEMSLSEAVESGVTEVILTDLGDSELASKLNSLIIASDFRLKGGGSWVYKYTAQPYAFYYHTGTKKWKLGRSSSLEHIILTTFKEKHMSKTPFQSPLSRLFPKKIVNYYLTEIDKILVKYENATLSEKERKSLLMYKESLQSNRIYYEKASLDFVREIYPLILKKEATPDVQFLYTEILRINPKLISKRLGNEIFFNKIL